MYGIGMILVLVQYPGTGGTPVRYLCGRALIGRLERGRGRSPLDRDDEMSERTRYEGGFA